MVLAGCTYVKITQIMVSTRRSIKEYWVGESSKVLIKETLCHRWTLISVLLMKHISRHRVLFCCGPYTVLLVTGLTNQISLMAITAGLDCFAIKCRSGNFERRDLAFRWMKWKCSLWSWLALFFELWGFGGPGGKLWNGFECKTVLTGSLEYSLNFLQEVGKFTT